MLLPQLLRFSQHSGAQVSADGNHVGSSIGSGIQSQQLLLVQTVGHAIDFTHVDVADQTNGRGNQRHRNEGQ